MGIPQIVLFTANVVLLLLHLLLWRPLLHFHAAPALLRSLLLLICKLPIYFVLLLSLLRFPRVLLFAAWPSVAAFVALDTFADFLEFRCYRCFF